VLDSQGRIYTQVYGDRLRADKLGEPLRLLLTNSPLPRQAPITALIERVRILCTVYDPDTGEYRTNYALVFELVGGLGFFVSVGWYLLADWRARRRARHAAPTGVLPASKALH
jgi:protein SCO1/2